MFYKKQVEFVGNVFVVVKINDSVITIVKLNFGIKKDGKLRQNLDWRRIKRWKKLTTVHLS